MTKIHKPRWFSDSKVAVSTAGTCGLTRGGRPLFKVCPDSGQKIQEADPETGAMVDAIDDQLALDAAALVSGGKTPSLNFIPADELDLRAAVPIYYDRSFVEQFKDAMKDPSFRGFRFQSLGDLVEDEYLEIRGGHGSPSSGERIGEVPYIKVSDLRAGLVNINPTNRVPLKVAEKHWRGGDSELKAYDLLCPERTSKNIGDFCILLPGQERVVLTKEILVLRPGRKANFDPFYLLWALTLSIVRNQWKRIIFMQTNREDVGKRYLEVLLPVPKDRDRGLEASKAFRDYFETTANARNQLSTYLAASGGHHFFVSGAQ